MTESTEQKGQQKSIQNERKNNIFTRSILKFEQILSV